MAKRLLIRNKQFDDRQLDVERIANIIELQCIHHRLTKHPKVIHLIHKTVEQLEKSRQQWQSLNPEYTIELYDDERCKRVLMEHFGTLFVKVFEFIKDGAIKCDFFRVCVLYVYGGIYADADIKPLLPLSAFVEEDTDFATCISYNYLPNNHRFSYNPQFILSKKGEDILYRVMNKYVSSYINRVEYAYWEWSICKWMEKIDDFELSSTGNNIFHRHHKKYQFFIENICGRKGEVIYNFSNFNHREYVAKYNDVVSHAYITHENSPIFENFGNK